MNIILLLGMITTVHLRLHCCLHKQNNNNRYFGIGPFKYIFAMATQEDPFLGTFIGSTLELTRKVAVKIKTNALWAVKKRE